MKQETVKCPGCGSFVDVVEGAEVQFCQYCGTRIILKEDPEPEDKGADILGIGKAVKSYAQMKDNEKKRAHQKEMEEERYLREHPEERIRQEKETKKVMLVILAILIAVFAFIFYMAANE